MGNETSNEIDEVLSTPVGNDLIPSIHKLYQKQMQDFELYNGPKYQATDDDMEHGLRNEVNLHLVQNLRQFGLHSVMPRFLFCQNSEDKFEFLWKTTLEKQSEGLANGTAGFQYRRYDIYVKTDEGVNNLSELIEAKGHEVGKFYRELPEDVGNLTKRINVINMQMAEEMQFKFSKDAYWSVFYELPDEKHFHYFIRLMAGTKPFPKRHAIILITPKTLAHSRNFEYFYDITVREELISSMAF